MITRVIPALWALFLGVLSTTALASDGSGSGHSCWQSLAFGASRGFLSASITLDYESSEVDALTELPKDMPPRKAQLPISHDLKKITASFAAMRSKGEQQIWYDPNRTQVLQLHRTSIGSSRSRAKLYRFLTDGVYRERREPLEGSKDDLQSWTITSRQVVDYPQDRAKGLPVLNSSMLLGEAASMADANEARRTVLAFTDTQLFRVQLESRGIETYKAKFIINQDGEQQRIKGKRKVMRIGIEASLLGDDEEDKPFTLLELSGDLSILIDLEYGLPILVEGSWYRIGTIPAALEQASLLASTTPDCAH